MNTSVYLKMSLSLLFYVLSLSKRLRLETNENEGMFLPLSSYFCLICSSKFVLVFCVLKCIGTRALHCLRDVNCHNVHLLLLN